MRLKSIKFLSVSISCLVLIVSGYIVLTQHHTQNQTPEPMLTTTPTKLVRAAGIPSTIKIPTIQVDAAIDMVGTTPAGDMEAPKSPMVTGWYKSGPRPGTVGSAVIAGHYGDSSSKVKSAFDNLNNLKIGDEITISDDANETFTFVVTKTLILGRNDSSQDVFTSDDGESHLNLITCHGAWEQSEQTYSDRFIVYTNLKRAE